MKPFFQRLLIFDLSNLIYRATLVKTEGGDLKTSTGYPSGHIYRIFSMIYNAKRDFGGDMYFVTEGNEMERFRLHPGYKEGRTKIASSFDPIPDIQKLISYMRASFIIPINAEADDGIYTLCQKNKKARITIISNDRDLWTCMQNGKTIVQGRSKETFYKKDAQKKFGVENLNAIPLIKALYGDESDKIPSVPRLNKKDMNIILNECLVPDDVYARIDKLKFGNQKKLIDYEKQFRIMFQVASLRMCKYDKTKYKGNKEKMKEFLEEFECKSLFNKIDLITGDNV